MVVDRSRSVIAPMNPDPQSEVFNAEMGVVIDGPALADTLARHMERDMAPANSWQVVAAPDGSLRWHSSAGTLAREPARQLRRRVQNLLVKLMPASSC